jgi:site-specific DNA-methyltransferase (adenine-specific)
MGKKWDNSGIAYSVELWTECLRVLKPGGHLLAFSGSRTYHRMVVAIEDAGFEVRDMISWISNKTFPKSLDVSKAIDKAAPRAGMFDNFAKHFGSQRAKKGLTQKQIAQYFPSKTGGLTGCVWNWENGANVPTLAQWKVLEPMLQLSSEWLPLIERIEAEREVTGKMDAPASSMFSEENSKMSRDVDITAPSTPEAQKWQGWGTGLKPTVEPIVMARKPLIGTVAANVLEHGTGALNIDGSRIGTTEAQGRWPANVILDEYSAGELDEQSGTSSSKVTAMKAGLVEGIGSRNLSPKATAYESVRGHSDSGGASRFFYVAKASKLDRNEGLEDSNLHPTVKPTTLMRYLVKLITPPGGTVLDPFTGSGSTGKAAILEGFDFIGIEMTEEYLPIIDARLKHAEQAKLEEQQTKDEGLF